MNELVALADGVFAWVQEPAGWEMPNAGVIVEDDGITVVDTLLLPSQARELAAALEPFGVPVRRVVFTSSHIAYTGGSTAFPLAAVYGTAQISDHLDQDPNTVGYQHLFPEHADEFVELRTRTVSHVVTDANWLSSAVVVAPVSGQIAQNLVVQVPDAGVVFAGAMASFGVLPLAFDGNPATWADELARMSEWGVLFVPGIGGIGGKEDLDVLADYLRHCVDTASEDGDGDAAWADWAHQEFDEVNLERASMLARGDANVPPSMLRLLGSGVD